MPEPHFHIKEGDTASAISGVLEGESGAVSIAGATLRFIMSPIAGGTAVVNAAATNNQVGDGSDGSRGRWSYQWTGAQTGEPGWYVAEVQVTYSGGGIQSFPNDGPMLIAIAPELGS
jgi:hypothetical protein